MLPTLNKAALGAALVLAAIIPAPALADVKAGVDAWSRGDYTAAVREWEAPAAAGDADAMFNLGQAYRLGRGVPVDLIRAEDYYSRAAAAGHIRAADTYGLMLFQDGRREAALPYVQGAARRGDPRAEYLLGIAYFNGDILQKDWVRAYALLTLANGAGLPQAATALGEMDRAIPLSQRQEGAGLAVQLKEDADSARATEVAAAELGVPAEAPVQVAVVAAPPVEQPVAVEAPAQVAVVAAPPVVEIVSVSPSVAAAQAAIAEATRANGTEDPAQAGAAFALGEDATWTEQQVAMTAEPVVQPVVVAVAETPQPDPVPVAVAAAEPAAVSESKVGPWRVQLGAFSVAGNADRLWDRLSGRSELEGRERLMIPAGRVTKLQAGGFSDRASADAACRSLKSSGVECLVTRS